MKIECRSYNEHGPKKQDTFVITAMLPVIYYGYALKSSYFTVLEVEKNFVFIEKL